jgi:twinkle protein
MPFVQTHLPCADCGSSDAKAIDALGRWKCFACGRRGHDADTASDPVEAAVAPSEPSAIPNYTAQSIPSRSIVKSTLERYRSGVTADGAILFSYGAESAKLRYPDKRFRTVGAWKSAVPLFGMDVFPPASARGITITEGEVDALSAYQMSGNYPCVSIKNGAASAAADCAAAYEYLDSFEDIVVCFDADAPGLAAARAVAELFSHKARVFEHVNGHKDANDYLVNGDEAAYKRCWYNARRYLPDGIIDAGSLRERLETPIQRSPLTYPFPSLNKMTYGIRFAELITLCAGSGLGKTTLLREIIDNVLINSDYKVGLMFLEETPERTMRGLVGLAINKPIHLPDVVYDASDIDRAYESRRYDDRVMLWDHFGSNSIDAVLSRMRFLVRACGVSIIVLDHLSMLVSDQAVADERKAIDEIMTKLRTFVQAVNVSLLLVSHMRSPEGKKSLEDGGVTSLSLTRGSRSIGQLSDVVIGVERDSQAEDLRERNTTKIRILKNRLSGNTGICCDVYYDAKTGRLTEV